MVVTLGQQYNIGEKPTVILYTYYINHHAGTPEKHRKQKRNNVLINSTGTSLYMAAIIYCYICYKYKLLPLLFKDNSERI